MIFKKKYGHRVTRLDDFKKIYKKENNNTDIRQWINAVRIGNDYFYVDKNSLVKVSHGK